MTKAATAGGGEDVSNGVGGDDNCNDGSSPGGGDSDRDGGMGPGTETGTMTGTGILLSI